MIHRLQSGTTPMSPVAENNVDPEAATKETFKHILKNSVLRDTSDAFIHEISEVAADRIYAPGDLVTLEGQTSASMFVMASGRAGVFKKKDASGLVLRGAQLSRTHTGQSPAEIEEDNKIHACKVGTLNAGDICGELSMLGVLERRLATVEAETICTAWEITEEDSMRIIERHPEARKHFTALIIKHLGHTVMSRVTQLSLFSQFENKVRTYLALYSEQRVYFQKQKIVREGQAGTHLMILNIGSATMEKKGVVVKTYLNGSYFGATVMLGVDATYLGTLVAYQTCHIVCISYLSFTQVLEQYPSPKVKEALKASETSLAKELRANATRIAARKRIWKRYQNFISDSLDPAGARSEPELLQTTFTAWQQTAVELREKRERLEEERANNDRTIEAWITKRRDAKERVRQQKEAALAPLRLVDRRIVGTSPLRLGARGKTWIPSMADEFDKLPEYVPSSPARRSQREPPPDIQLDALMRQWPKPQPSRHYNLKVWGVLAESLLDPDCASNLLPVLVDRAHTSDSDGDARRSCSPCLGALDPLEVPVSLQQSSSSTSSVPHVSPIGLPAAAFSHTPATYGDVGSTSESWPPHPRSASKRSAGDAGDAQLSRRSVLRSLPEEGRAHTARGSRHVNHLDHRSLASGGGAEHPRPRGGSARGSYAASSRAVAARAHFESQSPRHTGGGGCGHRGSDEDAGVQRRRGGSKSPADESEVGVTCALERDYFGGPDFCRSVGLDASDSFLDESHCN